MTMIIRCCFNFIDMFGNDIRYHCRWRTVTFRLKFDDSGLWAAKDLYRTTLMWHGASNFAVSSKECPPPIPLVVWVVFTKSKGYWGPILTRTPLGLGVREYRRLRRYYMYITVVKSVAMLNKSETTITKP